MIDNKAAVRWLSEGVLLCPSHAEGRWGAGLYRVPRPVGNDGLEIEGLFSPHWEKFPCKRCEEQRQQQQQSPTVDSHRADRKSWDVV